MEINDDYKKIINDLENKSNQLKEKLDNYNYDGDQIKWALFSINLKYEIEDLGRSLREVINKRKERF